MPKVSVIIATYNRASIVTDAINSVLSQTFKDFELIVVDDGSTDNTKDVLNKYTNSISYFYQENVGRSGCRNTGIKAARGDYIAFLDDDDLWLPEKLEKQVAFLDDNPEISLVHTFTEVIDERGNLLPAETSKRLRLYRQAMRIGYTYEGMSRLSVMFLSSVMLRRECFDKVGLFDTDIPAFEDWDFYLRFALNYHIATITEPLVRYRMHNAQSTQDEFVYGWIETSLKNLNLLNSVLSIRTRNKVHQNFLLHLASAYYIASDFKKFRQSIFEALTLNPCVLFYSRTFLHLAVSFLPYRMINKMRSFKKHAILLKTSVYPERIVPEETFGGVLATHLKRYDFAKAFCKDKVVLDAACGVGYGTNYLSEITKEVIGIDASLEAITLAKEHYQRKNIQFKVMDAHKLEFPDKYFDLVCSFETLEHLKEPERFLSEVRRVLKEDGVFLVSTPYVKKIKCRPRNPYHKVEFSKEDFRALLEKYFRNVEIFGQRRLQSNLHYYLQQFDIFHLRALLPIFLRRKICHTIATHSWDDAGLEDFVISKEGIGRAAELIGVCNLANNG